MRARVRCTWHEPAVAVAGEEAVHDRAQGLEHPQGGRSGVKVGGHPPETIKKSTFARQIKQSTVLRTGLAAKDRKIIKLPQQ